MEKEKLIRLLKNQNLAFYTTISNNIENITKDQLKDILLSIILQTSNYIPSPTILNHLYNDVIEDIKTTWKVGEK